MLRDTKGQALIEISILGFIGIFSFLGSFYYLSLEWKKLRCEKELFETTRKVLLEHDSNQKNPFSWTHPFKTQTFASENGIHGKRFCLRRSLTLFYPKLEKAQWKK